MGYNPGPLLQSNSHQTREPLLRAPIQSTVERKAGPDAGSDRPGRNLSSGNRNSELACLFAFEKFQPGSAKPWRRKGICRGWGGAGPGSWTRRNQGHVEAQGPMGKPGRECLIGFQGRGTAVMPSPQIPDQASRLLRSSRGSSHPTHSAGGPVGI